MGTTRYVPAAEVNKMIRRTLKREFPGVKFSVRGTSSTHVEWTDGPTSREVDSKIGAYAGSRFDPMIDLGYSASTWHCDDHGPRVAETYGHSFDNGPVASRCCAKSELIHSLASYVFTRRNLSDELRAEIVDRLQREYGITYTPGGYNDYDADMQFGRLANETSR